MKQKKYLWILYLIITTIMISIATQIYFNFKNYQINKQQFINEVQISLDNATDVYYSELIKTAPNFDKLFTSINSDDIRSISVKKNLLGANLTVILDTVSDLSTKTITSSLHNKSTTAIDSSEITVFLYDGKFKNRSKIKMDWDSFDKKKHTKKGNKRYLELSNQKATDSIKFIRNITKLYSSFSSDSLNFKKLDSIIKTEFNRKNIQMPYQLNHFRFNQIIATNKKIDTTNTIKTLSKSVYLKRNEKIELIYPNQTKTYLKKGLLGIFLSLLLAIAIISSLFYLLNIIKKQKQIAEIKNDFISNITHEFKTPITTIGLATEAIVAYNKQNNKEKANEYLKITKSQLKKLNAMVEKVLETSTLDNDKLLLKKEPIDIVKLLEKSVQKQFISKEKSIIFNSNIETAIINVDLFHFENAINNLIDNAIKYGGNKIEVNIQSVLDNLEITIDDNGNINKQYQNKIFDKFYRIPQGNTHDVKGFGIGLYYSKNIIEKHNGTLELQNTTNTVFKITLPK